MISEEILETVDPYIRPLIVMLNNKHNIPTIFSCSGIPSEHIHRGGYRSSSPYICLRLDSLSTEQLIRISLFEHLPKVKWHMNIGALKVDKIKGIPDLTFRLSNFDVEYENALREQWDMLYSYLDSVFSNVIIAKQHIVNGSIIYEPCEK